MRSGGKLKVINEYIYFDFDNIESTRFREIQQIELSYKKQTKEKRIRFGHQNGALADDSIKKMASKYYLE